MYYRTFREIRVIELIFTLKCLFEQVHAKKGYLINIYKEICIDEINMYHKRDTDNKLSESIELMNKARVRSEY